jgi:ATP-binding cassette subfamily F protein uup
MDPAILNLRDIHLTFGGTPLLEGAEISVSAGDRLALVGRTARASRRCSKSQPG